MNTYINSDRPMNRHYIVWYTDENEKGEYENYYLILNANSLGEAKADAEKMFGEYVISVEPYEP